MMSRLWTNSPLKPDGTLDYAQLTVAEVCEDLTESLVDRVVNSGLEELQPFLNDLPSEDDLPSVAPTDMLARSMEDLLRLEGEDPDFRSAEAHEAIRVAIGELKLVVNRPAGPGACT
jgi:hypothetical protein